uniref:Uncharacterized protein n=1 Tax=Acrobeloides nanus TaxID=290746 RepID=A0A914DBL7_9BILA
MQAENGIRILPSKSRTRQAKEKTMEMELDHIIGMLRVVNLCDYRCYNCDCLDYEEIASNRHKRNRIDGYLFHLY